MYTFPQGLDALHHHYKSAAEHLAEGLVIKFVPGGGSIVDGVEAANDVLPLSLSLFTYIFKFIFWFSTQLVHHHYMAAVESGVDAVLGLL